MKSGSGCGCLSHVGKEAIAGALSVFMNKFRKLDFIGYNGGLKVHEVHLGIGLQDSPSSDR